MKRRDLLKGMAMGGVAGVTGLGGLPGVWTGRNAAWAAGGDIPVGVLF